MKPVASIATQFTRYTWIIGVVSCIAVLFITINSEIGLLKRQTSIEISRIYDAAEMEVDRFFFKDQILVTYLNEKAATIPAKQRLKWIGDNLRQSKKQTTFVILDKQGRIAYVSDPKNEQYLGLDFSNLEYVKFRQKVSGVHQSFFTSRPVVTISYPLRDGLLLIEKDVFQLAQGLKGLPRPSVDGSRVFILNRQGTVIYHPNTELIKTRENLLSTFGTWTGPDRYGFFNVINDGARYWCMKKGFSRPNTWTFYAAIPETKIVPYLWHHVWPIAMTIFGIFMAVVFFVDFMINRGISLPVKRLSQWLSNIDPLKPETIEATALPNVSNRELLSMVQSARQMIETIKSKNAEITKRDELFRTVIEYAADWAYWLDEKGTFKYNSIKCRDITGYSPEEFQENPDLLIKIIHEDDRPRFKEHIETIIGTKPHRNMEFRIVTKDGRIRWISHNCNKIFDGSGNFMGVRGSNLDITEQKLASEELSKIEKLESLGVVAGGLAHDFNNMLTAILGNISLALMEVDASSNLHKRLRVAEKACHRAQSLTQQLLTFAKGGTPVKKPSSLKRIILETAEFSLKGSNVACRFDFDQELWMVEVDPGQISQVLQNLILNADQAMPNGGILRITARNKKVDEETSELVPAGRYVRITVQDEGVGIPKKLLSKIFDPYFTTKEHGSGLGLAICFSIIRKHGGYIKVESEQGKGSSFHIFLPALDKTAKEQDEKQNTLAEIAKGRTILIMDDDPNILQLLQEGLKYLGLKTESATDGNEAIKKYKKAMEDGDPFDAVIMDLTVPGGMGGREALKRLLEIDPNAKVIVSSGYSKDDTVTNYKRYGFCASLPKPYKLEMLNSVLLSVFSA